MTRQVPDWSPFSPESLADPVATDRGMRQKCPVAYTDDGGGFYAVFRHEDINTVIQERETFISRPTISVPLMAPGAPPWVPLQADLPDHRFFRKVLIPFFTASRMKSFAPRLREMTNELIDGFIGRGEGDLAKELCLAVPARAICLLLGLPEEDWVLLDEWTVTSMQAAGRGDMPGALAVQREMADYGDKQLEARRTEPKDDVLTAMLNADIDGRPMTAEELNGMFLLLAEAGHETTANALVGSALYLAQNPETRRWLAGQPEIPAGAIEELLRYTAPVRGLARTTTRDVEIGGRVIPEGAQVALMFSSGSRDEEVFEDPDTCDFTRDASKHLTFGRGIHRCLGEHLARVEMQVVLSELLRRIPDFELVGTPVPALWPNSGYRSLPVRF
jgi:cytochrome P450